MAASGNRQRRSTTRKNVVHRGQRATLNGKPVIADGKGNWVAVTKGTYGNAQYGGAKAGSYKKGEDRPRAQTKTTPKKRGMSNIPPKEAQPGSPSYVKPRSTTPSASTLSTRKNVTPTPTAPKKVKAKTVAEEAKTVAEGRMTWARKYSGKKYKGTAIGKEAKAYLSKQEKKKQLTKAQQSTGAKVLRKTNNKIG
tara:strand:+ start:1073 stop:1657 length:585 start_codon:yes stop_codon:yes gene_type:complete